MTTTIIVGATLVGVLMIIAAVWVLTDINSCLRRQIADLEEMLNDYRDESGKLLPAFTSSPDSEAGPCDMRIVRLEEPITGHTDCGRIGTALPIRGNPDIKTCTIDELMVEMGNRSVSCIGVLYAEYLLPDGRVGRHPHIFYSGDPMMQLGMIDMLREFVRHDHVGDIINYKARMQADDGEEQGNGVPRT